MGAAGRSARAAPAAAAVACGLLLAGAAIGAVPALRDLDARADRNSALDWGDREIAWGNGWTLTSDALYAARSLIPPGAEYEVLVGPPERFRDPLTAPYVASYLHYFLMPRHPATGARWVVCYRCERPPGEVVWTAPAEGIAVLRRRA